VATGIERLCLNSTATNTNYNADSGANGYTHLRAVNTNRDANSYSGGPNFDSNSDLVADFLTDRDAYIGADAYSKPNATIWWYLWAYQYRGQF